MDLLLPVWQLAMVALASSAAVVFVLGLSPISNTLWAMLLLGVALEPVYYTAQLAQDSDCWLMDATVAEFEPNNDAAKLAKIGAHVAARLNANPRVQRLDHADAQVYVHQGFLSLEECKGLIDLIDAAAVPSTLFAGTEQAGFRTSSSCHLNC